MKSTWLVWWPSREWQHYISILAMHASDKNNYHRAHRPPIPAFSSSADYLHTFFFTYHQWAWQGNYITYHCSITLVSLDVNTGQYNKASAVTWDCMLTFIWQTKTWHGQLYSCTDELHYRYGPTVNFEFFLSNAFLSRRQICILSHPQWNHNSVNMFDWGA